MSTSVRMPPFYPKDLGLMNADLKNPGMGERF